MNSRSLFFAPIAAAGVIGLCGLGEAPPVPARPGSPLGAVEARAPIPEDLRPAAASLVEGSNAFALDLYRSLSAEPGNLIFSPFSVSAALAMAYAGAAGETRNEMTRVMHIDPRDLRLHEAWEAVLAGVRGTDRAGPVVRVANRLWGQRGHHFLDGFLSVTRRRYGAELEALDFAGAPAAARETIDAWTAKATGGKWPHVLPAPLDPLTVLVITNAIYFRALWTDPFDPRATYDEPFHLASGEDVTVRLMHGMSRFRYGEMPDGTKLVELPYDGRELSMLVVLPPAPAAGSTGLEGIERAVSFDQVRRWIESLSSEEVSVALPRFRMESSLDLAPTLSALGMPAAFDAGRAEFSGMTADQVFISHVYHGAFVDVTERGTEAGAATHVAVVESAEEVGRFKEFRADRPFLFLIRDDAAGSILFIGRLADPRD